MLISYESWCQAAEKLSPEKLQEYKDVFSFFDRDGGGSIGAEELEQVMLIVDIGRRLHNSF